MSNYELVSGWDGQILIINYSHSTVNLAFDIYNVFIVQFTGI